LLARHPFCNLVVSSKAPRRRKKKTYLSDRRQKKKTYFWWFSIMVVLAGGSTSPSTGKLSFFSLSSVPRDLFPLDLFLLSLLPDLSLLPLSISFCFLSWSLPALSQRREGRERSEGGERDRRERKQREWWGERAARDRG